ncbi:twin-arginine translocase subunit TatC [Solitalea koreensis]|uniref:Sec-independent protein translocase protein TatC n=1 Tax=Solitalea koreensis TaxID=543615 RepID=A0A521AQW9_9SPHI|nr:twin-arginine translocase subunit TatC [Solitalea koreensis]SMO37185.1 sec-independent protein translocase protein TatC [Solitalea koreensis]
MPNSRRDTLVSKYLNKDKHTIEAEMSFFDHLEELRWHIIRSVIAISVFTGIAFSYKEFVFDNIILGPKNTDFWTYRMMCHLAAKYNLEDFCVSKINFVIMNTELSGQFMIHLNSSIMLGIALAFPYFIWELWRFIRPALKSAERRYASGLIFFISLLFFLGMLFGYFIIVPLTIVFLGSYTVSTEIINQISLDSYLSTLGILSIGCGITFEMPIVIYFLSKLGFVTPKLLRSSRRYAVVIILLIAAFITPSPDMMTQTIVALPLFILYEISIFVSAGVAKNKARKEALEEEEYSNDRK